MERQLKSPLSTSNNVRPIRKFQFLIICGKNFFKQDSLIHSPNIFKHVCNRKTIQLLSSVGMIFYEEVFKIQQDLNSWLFGFLIHTNAGSFGVHILTTDSENASYPVTVHFLVVTKVVI